MNSVKLVMISCALAAFSGLSAQNDTTFVANGNPIIKYKYTADPGAMVHDGKVYIYAGHDECPPPREHYQLNEWCVSSSPDMKTWTEHPSSRSALQESVCMASLIKVNAKDNITGKDLLLFSNPNTTKGRNHITIKASLDGGLTWPTEHQVLLDEAEGWGYSCLSMIDKETVGIFYESSVAHMTFQAVKLTDLIP